MLYLSSDRLLGSGLDGEPIPQLATELPTKWTGWTPHYDANRPVFSNGMIQSYLDVRPRTGATATGFGSGGGVVPAVVLALACVAGALVWLLPRRRRDGQEEEV